VGGLFSWKSRGFSSGSNLSKCNSWQAQPRISPSGRSSASFEAAKAEPLRASGRHRHARLVAAPWQRLERLFLAIWSNRRVPPALVHEETDGVLIVRDPRGELILIKGRT
jgi:hypothetical protein